MTKFEQIINMKKILLSQGPLVNANQLNRVSQIVESSIKDGAKLISGNNTFFSTETC